MHYPRRVPRPAPLPAAAIDRVLAWFDAAGRDLPWRREEATPWAILVSEIMLQQTPVARVLPRWQHWMGRWPAPADLAAAPASEVLRAWDRLGYPRRALRLHECARTVVREHAGALPTQADALRQLPGIGEYTAAAVAAFAFGQRTVVADTNVRRVIVRSTLGIERPAPSYTAAERSAVAACVPLESARSVRWNQAVMELGALVCTSRSPQCGACPLREDCAWFAAGRPVDPAAPRRRQAFEGTDRQMRGQVMAVLREHGSADVADLLSLDRSDEARVRRCLASLLRDGLAESAEAGADEDALPVRVRLPEHHAAARERS